MANEFGNIVKLPGLSGVSEARPSEILASMARFTQKGCTLAQGQGIIAAGTVLAYNSVTKKHVVYVNGGGETDPAVGVLRQTTDTTDGDAAGNIVKSGILKYSALTGMDSGAVTDLNGRIDEPMDYFIF